MARMEAEDRGEIGQGGLEIGLGLVRGAGAVAVDAGAEEQRVAMVRIERKRAVQVGHRLVETGHAGQEPDPRQEPVGLLGVEFHGQVGVVHAPLRFSQGEIRPSPGDDRVRPPRPAPHGFVQVLEGLLVLARQAVADAAGQVGVGDVGSQFDLPRIVGDGQVEPALAVVEPRPPGVQPSAIGTPPDVLRDLVERALLGAKVALALADPAGTVGKVAAVHGRVRRRRPGGGRRGGDRRPGPPQGRPRPRDETAGPLPEHLPGGRRRPQRGFRRIQGPRETVRALHAEVRPEEVAEGIPQVAGAATDQGEGQEGHGPVADRGPGERLDAAFHLAGDFRVGRRRPKLDFQQQFSTWKQRHRRAEVHSRGFGKMGKEILDRPHHGMDVVFQRLSANAGSQYGHVGQKVYLRLQFGLRHVGRGGLHD